MIRNPVLKGFCPDPSIVRAGEDFYIATSTFEWWPGVKLFHSKDLKHWEQLPSPLRDLSLPDLTGDPTSGGVWAPCLSCDGDTFYLVFTDVKTKKGRYYNTHNYLTCSKDILGKWSEPVYLNSIGFDPSLFHDTDGKKYLINMVNGFKGILVQEIEPGSWRLKGERKKVYDGSGIGCTEGPHMYHIGEWYYLLTAEGGTGYDHCVTIARSRSVWGPFETDPENPVLTSDKEDPDALQKCGHADLVETQGGEWYMAHLCSRPASGKWSVLGRETALQKVEWSGEGWLRLASGGRFAAGETEASAGLQEALCENDENGFADEFTEPELHVRYCAPRRPHQEFADCRARAGWLRITGQESLNSLHRVSLVAARQQELCCTAETAMEFSPEFEQQLGGLAYMYDAMNFYLFGKTADPSGGNVLVLLKSDTGVITEEAEPVPIPKEGSVRLRAETSGDGLWVRFLYQVGSGDWIPMGEKCSTEILTDEHCRGFTGAHFGLYAHDMTGLKGYTDFDYFRMKYGNNENR